MKVLELFGGIGACSTALKRVGVDFEIADYVEIDKYAVKSFNAINNTNFEPQDVKEWDKDLEVDLIMHGSPCQDFSIAGRQAGGDETSGTRSSLMYETIRIVEKIKPKYVIWENVKNILSKKHRNNFDNYISRINELDYKSYYQVLNAKDYGIPQNRERVFTISIRNDLNQPFEFPPKQELKLKLKDLLESEVDEKYYLSDEIVKKLVPLSNTDNTNVFGNLVMDKWQDRMKRIYSTEKYAPTISTMQCGSLEPKIMIGASRGRNPYNPSDRTAGQKTEQRLEINTNGVSNTITTVLKDNYCIIGSTQKHASVRNDGVTPTLTSSMGLGGGHVPMHNYNFRIRKLTPKECWRLMGFNDEDFEKAEKVNSNTQLYKQAGNSIVVNVLESILRNLFNKQGD